MSASSAPKGRLLIRGAGPFALVGLSWWQEEANQIAQSVHQRHDLRWQPAMGVDNALVLSPPFAPAAF
ncbi:MAG: hypothetical protein TE42_07170 [Candidatus Synechococcus spongiarum SP3]|uniref:Uncharacterized protein n=1 Tax=Candidatus Synechococcus spongiarum SP3 TaxID=1604020 RepID=A0A0G2HKA3_9SYNE|nr:MAG: hypothetical protein TE42_07170 [Candidatus Synechococcus spongiarum SP3]